MDVDSSDHGSLFGSDDQEPWQQTRAGKRIGELKEVEENIAALLHFAGCTLASLHPDPLSSFTSRELATDDDNAAGQAAQKQGEGEDKLADFSKYAEGYFATLNDVQLALRTSIRHLRVNRVSPAPLLDPSFASLATAGPGAGVGVGGVALGDLLAPLPAKKAEWDGKGERIAAKEEQEKGEKRPKVSVAALELERDAWREVARSLEGGRS
ncbi:hypothetical protein JCM10207_005047 [Rhodosporidiobolus poonsookiae]